MSLPRVLWYPSRRYSPLPFWFLNDTLEEHKLLRQLDDFKSHGIHGFVLHPRVGLPRSFGWMSEEMLRWVKFIVLAAQVRRMKVVLYDEGMYPSGSASGQVVAEDPENACKGLERLPLASPVPDGAIELAQNDLYRVVVRPIQSVIRGLHYIGEGPDEDTPPAADLLRPQAVESFLRHSYEPYFRAVGEHFGKTVIGIFTDEPDLLGRCQETGILPGSNDLTDYVSPDILARLCDLWDDPDLLQRYKAQLFRRLEETYYQPLSEWCSAHGIALMGHPAAPDETAVLRHFHVPGQDLVWRRVLPFEPSAIEGPESTQAKGCASTAYHLGRRRNGNECFGAYGHELTLEDMYWLANWCFVRGTNLLYPHAFYYSVRGPRREERPPDVGPNSPWWNEFRPFAEHCARLAWVNTDSRPICDVAILAPNDSLPWRAAKVLYENQIDFHYVNEQILRSGLEAHAYRAFLVDGFHPATDLPVVDCDDPTWLAKLIERGVAQARLSKKWKGLRYRHVVKRNREFLMLFNEGRETIQDEFTMPGWEPEISLLPGEMKLLIRTGL